MPDIKTLYHFEPSATGEEVRASAMQFVRKLSGLATPAAGTHPTPLKSWPIGQSAKFTPQGVAGGHIFVGTNDGHLIAFGTQASALLTGSALAFPKTAVNASSVLTETLTARGAVTITSITSSNTQFAVGTPSPALPAALVNNGTLSVPVAFTPTSSGIKTGVLTIATSAGTVQEGMSGTGLVAGPQLTATPPSLGFGNAATGATVSYDVTFTATGSADLAVSSVTLPSAPYSVTGLPTAPFPTAGSSLTATVTFAPRCPGRSAISSSSPATIPRAPRRCR